MYSAILIFSLITVHVTAEILLYINVCGRRDPNLDQCIIDNINNLKGKLCDGLPELNIPSVKIYTLDKLVISDTSNTKIYIKNAQVTGLCDFDINYLHTDVEKLHFDFNLLFKWIQINATYDFDIRLLVPFAYKGMVYITTGMQIINVKKYVYVSKLKLNIDLKKYNAEYDFNDNTQLSQFREIIRNFVGNNQEEIIKTLKPILEETISKRIILISNDIVKEFTYEELFPDRI
ncbi:hypothetical protein P5V15_013751 [Pogonomyrmex californicus]